MRILTREEMRAAEDAAVAQGTSYEQLMENAGAATAGMLCAMAQRNEPILFLCGRGNNAGDAFVAARLLTAQGHPCVLALLLGGDAPVAPPAPSGLSTLASLQLARLRAAGQRAQNPPVFLLNPPLKSIPFGKAALIVDAVFGTGYHGALPKNVAAAFAKANKAKAKRVALDIPSGLDADTGEAAKNTFSAGATITYAAAKPGLLAGCGPALAGEVTVADIGC